MQILEIAPPGADAASDSPVYERIRRHLAEEESAGPLARSSRARRAAWNRRVVDTGVLLGTRGALWVACALAVLFTALSVYLVVRGGG